MMNITETSSPKLIGLHLSGRLHDKDYKQFVPAIERRLTQDGKTRLFVHLDDFHGWDLRAAWDELKFGLKHYSDFERIAIVGDRKWEKRMVGLSKPLTKARVRYFDKAAAANALEWLQEEPQEPTRRSIAPDAWGGRFWYGV